MKASWFEPGRKVRVVADHLQGLGIDNKGDTGVVKQNDKQAMFPIWVEFEEGEYEAPYNPEELALYPKAPMSLRVLEHLLEVGNLSGEEASSLYKCRSLPRRIKDLKDLNWPIKTKLKADRTGQRYARYELNV